jgi:hypothetical protein
VQVNYAKSDYQECRHAIKAIADIEGIVQSRFADMPEEPHQLVVISRFADKWKDASGE